MQMAIIFDCDIDIIDVPVTVINNREVLRKRFIKWIYDKNTKHKYWVKYKDRQGRTCLALKYRSDAFVEWLNKKVLSASDETAQIVRMHVTNYPSTMPTLEF